MSAVPDQYLNRELSLLDFQDRVLSIAERPDLPLLERLKFIAIVSQNLDEFFQVRVAGILNQIAGSDSAVTPDGMSPTQQMAAIHDRVTAMYERIDRTFTEQLSPLLEKADIRILAYADLEQADRDRLQREFDEEIFPVLTPLAVDPAHPFPYISNLSLNLAVVVSGSNSSDAQFARVKVPPNLSRFIQLDEHRFVPVEQVIADNVELLFPGRQILQTFAFRVTRSADLSVEAEEADDLLEAMESVLRFRQRSAGAVRLEFEADVLPEGVQLMRRELDLTDDLVFQRSAYLDLGALWAIVDLDRPDLKEPRWLPTTPERIGRGSDGQIDFFEEIRAGDLMVHHPYESFATSTGAFLAQAAHDPDVLAIKQALYRTSVPVDPALGGEETMVRSLMEAAESGKQVVVLVELKARFDEAANIRWAKMLEKSGVHVVYGVVGLKTHAKLLLVVRREPDGLRRYAHIGTGNYNPKTARLYEDLGIFTADPEIGRDLSELFNALTGFGQNSSYRRLLVAPATLRKRLTDRIREEAARGTEGRILFKLNHLVDPQMIDELYAASQQGCEIDLIVRGVCALRPGIPDLSPTIRVRSIVGRYLEHSRIYRFGDPTSGAVYYTGSADLMTRNLDRRVEALLPVVDPRLKLRLEELLGVLMNDDVLAWTLHDNRWTKVETVNGVHTHDRMQDLALERQRPGSVAI